MGYAILCNPLGSTVKWPSTKHRLSEMLLEEFKINSKEEIIRNLKGSRVA